MANKNSTYVQSLVSFILDTKPYHSKLTEVVEEYRFSDEMTVHFDERLFSSTTTKAAWLYSHFADGISVPAPTTKIHRLVSPLFRQFTDNSNPSVNRGAFKIGRDENTDLPLVPFAFDPKSIQGTGLADSFVQRNGLGTQNEGLVEGLDVFLSHGAHVFQIKQTISTQPIVAGRFTQEYTEFEPPQFVTPVEYPLTVTMEFSAPTMVITGPAVQTSSTTISVTGPGLVTVVGLSDGPNYDPQYVNRSNENLIATVTSTTQLLAGDKNNPASAISHIQNVLDMIEGVLSLHPDAASSTELANVQNIVDGGVLPSSYEALINALETAKSVNPNIDVPPGTSFDVGSGHTMSVTTWDEVHKLLSSYSPSLYFNQHTDLSVRESGAVIYDDVYRNDVVIKNIKVDPFRPSYEEWTLIAATSSSFFVRGSVNGIIGSATYPGTFTSPYLSFELLDPLDFGVQNAQPIEVGAVITLTPANKVVVHANAPLEAWSIIKVNPLAYSRPLFTSTRYGYVKDASSTRDLITILDASFPTCTVVLTALSSTKFSVTNTVEPSYYGEATVGQEFNDGRLQFTIVAGNEYTFQENDKFYIEIRNDAPFADDLDLYYGFDLAPFDGDEYVYNTISQALQDYQKQLDFGWDSRFINYDWAVFNLQLSQNAISDREWRVRALPNLSKPLPLQNSSPTNVVNLIAPEDPLNPDAFLQVDMADDVTSEGIRSSSDPDSIGDLQLWYSDSFAVEYFHTGLQMWVLAGTVNVGDTFNSTVHGISFTLIPGSKPFIAARLRSSWYSQVNGGPMQTGVVDGGDTFYWRARNNPPVQIGPAGVESVRAPRLVMHGDSYHFTAPARWYLNFSSGTEYTLQGFYTTGVQTGQPVFSTPKALSLVNGKSFYSRDDGLHWTIESGRGLGSGDQFTFETFEKKPIFLVHGSVSGWQPDAEIDKFYWNGKIGFKIRSPKVELFENDNLVSDWESSLGAVTVSELRYDSPSAVYRAYAHNDGYWTLYRDGSIVAAGANELVDKYIRVTLPDAVEGALLVIRVSADEMDFSLGQDLAIVRTTAGRSPTSDDFVLFSRTREDGVAISVKPTDDAQAAVLSNLAPTSIDLRYVDHTTGSGVPLSVTSQETNVLSGWLPALITKFDGDTSTADFSDAATTFEVRSAVIDQKIGTIRPRTSIDDVVFEWDSGFAATYLPLNTEASVVTYGSGMNDTVRVSITEGIQFLLGGGGLNEDMLFMDFVNVGFIENHLMKVKATYNTDFGVTIADGPFGGFLPGFDNMPFDLEDGVGGYFDAGQAFSDVFMRARALALQNVLTPQEQAEYNDLVALLAPYTNDPATMTFDQFTALLDAEPPVNYTPQYFGFGVPAIGMAMQIEDRPAESTGAAFKEAMTIRAIDFGYGYDQYGYDVGGMDVPPESSVIVLSTELPPLPTSGLPSGSYADFETPLMVPAPGGRVIEISFAAEVTTTPQIYVWRPTDPVPQIVSTFEKVSDNIFRFSIPVASEVKLVVV